MKKIVINLNNKVFYTLITLVLVFVIVGIVYAYNSGNPSVMGHSYNELQTCADGQILKVVGSVWTCVTETGGIDPSSIERKTLSFYVKPSDGENAWSRSIQCNTNQFPISCGTNKLGDASDSADSTGCYLDITNKKCFFWYDEGGAWDGGATFYCSCISN